MRMPGIVVMREPDRRRISADAVCSRKHSPVGQFVGLQFSTLGGRFFPAGPSLRPGETRKVFGFIQKVEHRWP